ncbi:MAG TPA: ABC transporter [Clostridiales bacterium]|nr:ABC transporter [Clostridiales bacterium]HBP52038.1 ABC transporter [Clostridiales bacterium]HCH93142.1 ABC transporter [Clostridiales bacterium]
MKDIIIKNFSCSYEQKTIFQNFDITFEQGKINVVLGGSGVGKTTLLNAMASLKSYEGSIEGCEGGVSYIFQNDRLIPSISVYKNLDLILKAVVKDKRVRKEMIESTAEALEISDVLKSLPSEISGGQAQRASMARAFLYPSDVLLLDEPFKALDTSLKARLINKFVALQRQSKKTVVFVTHAIDECLLCADNYFVFAANPVEVVLKGSILSEKQERKLTDKNLEDTRNQLLKALSEC